MRSHSFKSDKTFCFFTYKLGRIDILVKFDTIYNGWVHKLLKKKEK